MMAPGWLALALSRIVIAFGMLLMGMYLALSEEPR